MCTTAARIENALAFLAANGSARMDVMRPRVNSKQWRCAIEATMPA